MVWLVVKAEYAEGGNDTVLYNVVREALSGETTNKTPGKVSRLYSCLRAGGSASKTPKRKDSGVNILGARGQCGCSQRDKLGLRGKDLAFDVALL